MWFRVAKLQTYKLSSARVGSLNSCPFLEYNSYWKELKCNHPIYFHQDLSSSCIGKGITHGLLSKEPHGRQ